jgi:hypothetical protein
MLLQWIFSLFGFLGFPLWFHYLSLYVYASYTCSFWIEILCPFGGESLPNGLLRGLLAVQEDIPLWSELSTYMFSMFIFQKIIKTLLSPKRHLMWEKGCVAINVKVEELVIPTHSNLI